MTEANDSPSASFSASHRYLPVLLVLFIGSGCSALIYEIVWFQLLQLVIGSSAVSLGVLLGAFMGGMCLGSLVLPRIISTRRHPLRVYAILELAIGVFGVTLLFAMPYVGRLYTDNVGHGFAGILFRGVVCSLCLLPPTILMGATLPAIARWMETTKEGVSQLGFFYGANIAGAVFGCLLAGFYLLRVFDMATATYVAFTINILVALISFAVSFLAAHAPPVVVKSEMSVERSLNSCAVYVSILLSGMCALGAEVIWTRQLSLLLGASVYTFSIILSVFLIGLGIGSSAGAVLSRTLRSPRFALGCCQLCSAAAIAWTAYMLSNSLPYWPIDPALASTPWLNFQLDLARCMWAMLPATCLWGASFPLALAAAATDGKDPGKLVGGLYAANTVGAIIGAVGFSMVFIAWAGTQHTQQLLIALSAMSALLMFTTLLWQALATGSLTESMRIRTGLKGALMSFVAIAAAVFLVWTVPIAPRGLIAFGRNLPTHDEELKFIYVGEGMNASIAVSDYQGWYRNFHVSGKVVASTESQDMRLQRLLGHLSALVHRQPKSVLIVGCGAGVTAGCFVTHPSIEKIVVCEIESLIPPAAAEYFGGANHDVFKDERVTVVHDDARHYVLTTKEKFDIITSDPIHPWVKGAASLYSKEYFEMCKDRLNPGGVVTQWVPLYQSTEEAVKSEIATFLEVFPNGTIWSNDIDGKGYDIVLLGQKDKTKIDMFELQQRLDSGDHSYVWDSLYRAELVSADLPKLAASVTGIFAVPLGQGPLPSASVLAPGTTRSAIDLLATFAGHDCPDLRLWLKGAEINRDGNLRLQYLAGMGLNLYREQDIFDSILDNYHFPDGLFAASEAVRNELRDAVEYPRLSPIRE